MGKNVILNISKEFSKCPGARFKNESDYSGEEFREDFLLPKLEEAQSKGQKLQVILDGSAGYSTAFIEEAFGGLIRKGQYSSDVLNDLIFISDEDPTYIDDIKMYIQNAWKNRKV